MTPATNDTLWTRTFVLLCIVQFLGYAQHFVLQPTLPIYVTRLDHLEKPREFAMMVKRFFHHEVNHDLAHAHGE